jgi:hypothetical protein
LPFVFVESSESKQTPTVQTSTKDEVKIGVQTKSGKRVDVSVSSSATLWTVLQTLEKESNAPVVSYLLCF